MIRVLKRNTLRRFLVSIRFTLIHLAVIFGSIFPRSRKKKHFFNLDCHVSVIRDLQQGLERFQNINLVSWNISGHNFVFRRYFGFADPILEIHSETWKNLSDARKRKFLRIHHRYLEGFDGFNKPILLVVAIRFEHPYTLEPESWKQLTSKIKDLRKSGMLTIVANNQGDSDYLAEFGIENVTLVHSLCDYIKVPKSSTVSRYPVYARSPYRTQHIVQTLGQPWEAKEDALGFNHGWEEVTECAAVIYIPYNTSTMTLFELATLGITVYVPDKRLLKNLSNEFDGVLSELTFLQMAGQETPQDSPRFDGIRWDRESYFDWWLSRADFYASTLMPNVVQFSSFEELRSLPEQDSNSISVMGAISDRNKKLADGRHRLLEDFISRV